MNEKKILLGNEAMAHGLLEAGCAVATAYPGTPSSEILRTVIALRASAAGPLHVEWSVNEKVAFEVALANAYTGRRSAVAMKQVGLNVASDPFMSAAYTGVKGGLLVISADDPGPHSSQTEQDSRFFAMMAKVPVLDPASPEDAREMVHLGFALSERHEMPVMLRPTTRVCHSREDMELRPFTDLGRPPVFEKDPRRWAATPKFRLILHRALNDKIEAISRDEALAPVCENPRALGKGDTAIVASGAVSTYAQEVLSLLGLTESVPLYRVPMPYPLSPVFRDEVLARFARVLVLEESAPVIEFQMRDSARVHGRLSGAVANAGELLPEVVEETLRAFFGLPEPTRPRAPALPGRRPSLCPGCPHRATFHAIKRVFPKGIFPGDIGCYTLGINLGVVDTVLCMGASVSMAAGFAQAFKGRGEEAPPICATIGDSTFYHAGVPALVNAVVQDARFVLVVLDNATAAMTGHQPTPERGTTLDGAPVPRVTIEGLAAASGVRHVAAADPYDLPGFMTLLREAGRFAKSPEGGVAVVIARHPCLMDRGAKVTMPKGRVLVTEECKGCAFCVKHFECPAIIPGATQGAPVRIDENICTRCGVCLSVCPFGGLAREEVR